MTDPFNLDGRTALVTGANTGLGQAIACALARAGASIVAVGRSTMAETELLVTDIGRPCLAVVADLADTAGLGDVLAQAEALGPIDILVNNAGTIRRNDAIDFTEDDWDEVMNVNLKTVFFLSQICARGMLARARGGKIVNIASLLSFQGGIRIASYTASKSGLAGLTRLLACEWALSGINVNAIAPGYFVTNNTRPLRDDANRSSAILGRIPAGRWGMPNDIAGAATFLASSASDYVHGIVLPVDGGWLARRS